MKRVALSLLSLAPGALLLCGALVGTQKTASEITNVASGTVVASDDDDRAEVRRKVREGAPGTYIGDILEARDSSIARWADRKGERLTVWIQPRTDVADYTPAYRA